MKCAVYSETMKKTRSDNDIHLKYGFISLDGKPLLMTIRGTVTAGPQEAKNRKLYQSQIT